MGEGIPSTLIHQFLKPVLSPIMGKSGLTGSCPWACW